MTILYGRASKGAAEGIARITHLHETTCVTDYFVLSVLERSSQTSVAMYAVKSRHRPWRGERGSGSILRASVAALRCATAISLRRDVFIPSHALRWFASWFDMSNASPSWKYTLAQAVANDLKVSKSRTAACRSESSAKRISARACAFRHSVWADRRSEVTATTRSSSRGGE